MTATDLIAKFEEAHPGIELLTPSHAQWKQRRSTRGHEGQQHKPLGIAIPKTVDHVASIVRWAKASSVEITVRTGGNDFYGRNAVDDGLIIDMRDIKSITVADDRKTVTVGGGVISKDLIETLGKEGLVTPTGNTWIVGFVGWATLGGYGPLTNRLGMGFENIVGAEVVNSQGEIVQASEDMLEGIRGMGGNLGIITKLTVKVYPSFKLLSGMLMLECTPENINAVVKAEQEFVIPKELTIHQFILQIQSRIIGIMTTWASPDHDKGQKAIDNFIARLPPLQMSTVASKTVPEHFEAVPMHNAPWGGQNSFYIKDMSPSLAAMFNKALETMPGDVNMSWCAPVTIDHTTAPPNTFGAGTHCLLTFSDMVTKEESLEGAKKWTEEVARMLRDSGDESFLGGSYPPLTKPGSRTAEQIFGIKWEKAKDLKRKYDPEGVFRHAVPRMLEVCYKFPSARGLLSRHIRREPARHVWLPGHKFQLKADFDVSESKDNPFGKPTTGNSDRAKRYVSSSIDPAIQATSSPSKAIDDTDKTQLKRKASQTALGGNFKNKRYEDARNGDRGSSNAAFIQRSFFRGDLLPAFRPPRGWKQCPDCPTLIKSRMEKCFKCRMNMTPSFTFRPDDSSPVLKCEMAQGVCDHCNVQAALENRGICFQCLIKKEDPVKRCENCGFEFECMWDGERFVYNTLMEMCGGICEHTDFDLGDLVPRP